MFLANKKQDNQVKTYITYNKGRDWRLLQAPDADLRGDGIHCMLVSVVLKREREKERKKERERERERGQGSKRERG